MLMRHTHYHPIQFVATGLGDCCCYRIRILMLGLRHRAGSKIAALLGVRQLHEDGPCPAEDWSPPLPRQW